jgi:hypothetical protein
MTESDSVVPISDADLRAVRGGVSACDLRLLREAAAAAGKPRKAPMKAPYAFTPRDLIWGLDLAAVRLVHLLADAAEQPFDDKLAAVIDHAEYLATFHNEPDASIRFRAAAALLLAGAGGGAHPDAAAWLRAGQARLLSELEASEGDAAQTTLGAAAVLVTADRGLPLLPGLRAWFTATQEAPLPETPVGRSAMSPAEFLAALDLERPELAGLKDAAAGGSAEQALDIYAQHRVESLRGLTSYLGDEEPEVNLDEANDALRNILVLRAHMHRRHDFGEEVDWTTVLDGDIESNVSINNHSHLVLLATAYAQTGEAQYAEHCLDLLRSWQRQSPCPDVWQGQLQWRTLEVGGRMIRAWPTVMLRLLGFPGFADFAADMARSSLEHARYLEAHARTRGNWFQVETSGLGAVALLYPEFRESPGLLRRALRRHAWANGKYFFPDGFQTECSVYYHAFPLGCIGGLCRLAKAAGQEAPPELLDVYERGLEVFVHTAQPDLSMPLVNDVGPHVSYAGGPLQEARQVFSRDDFRYIASHRGEGKPPSDLSHAFPHAGYYVMRDGWEPADQYLLLDAGSYGSGHQHEDKLNFIFWAGGRCLIGDPGIYRYSADEFEDYFRSSRGHNVIQVDGKGQARRLLYDSQSHEVEEQVPDPNTVWLPGGACDYAAGSYRDGFATRLHALWSGESRDDERATLDTSVEHGRALFYVKGEYLVVRDLLLGEGEHGIEQFFHLAPIVEALSPEGVRPGRAVVDAQLGVRTAEADLGNVAIIPGQTEGRTLRFACGDRRPAAGYTCLYGERPAIDVIYEQRAALPLALDTVIVPMDAGRSECPRLVAQPLEVGEGVALRLQWPEQTDLILLSDEGQAELRGGELAAQARALWIRTDAAGKVVRGAGVQVQRAEYRGQTLRDLAS